MTRLEDEAMHYQHSGLIVHTLPDDAISPGAPFDGKQEDGYVIVDPVTLKPLPKWYGRTSAHLPPLNNKWYDSAIASGTLIEGKGDGTWTWGGLCIACLCIVTACVTAFVVVSRFLPTH